MGVRGESAAKGLIRIQSINALALRVFARWLCRESAGVAPLRFRLRAALWRKTPRKPFNMNDLNSYYSRLKNAFFPEMAGGAPSRKQAMAASGASAKPLK